MDEQDDNSVQQPTSTEDKTNSEAPQRQWRPQDADREYIKTVTRNRVRNAKVPPQAIFKPAKPAPTINDSGHKRVAVYARVSTKSTEQVSSIENQTKYYTEKIEKTENWEMQDIYKDEGKSGTSIKHRKDFLRMINDAAEQKMDLILCASVSRFARDISDCMEQIRRLKTAVPSHPVGVYFETEDIYTLDPTSSDRLEMHALFSGWESKNKSRRMILSYDQRICTGQYPVSDLLGYRHTYEGDLIIEPEEAKTVKFIFFAYISGLTLNKIAQILTEKSRPTLKGRTNWNPNMVRSIMYNERRWGDLDARKTICVDYKDKITVKNNQQRDAAFIPDHHEGIVTRAIATAAHMLSASHSSVCDGIPNCIVINSGLLKGFVSISPAWSGVDDVTLRSISKSVYSDEEYNKLVSLADISGGITESRIISMTFNGYEVPYGVYFMNQKSPTLTISKDHIKFNKACHTKFGSCSYIELLYHPILKMIATRSSTKDNPNAFRWENEKGIKFELSAKAFAKSIYDRTGWYHNFCFRFRGITRVRGNSKVLFFYLDEPQIIIDEKTRQKLKEASSPLETTQYIQYKESDGEHGVPIARHAYPDEWANSNFGVSLALRKQRDVIANEIQESDITSEGICVDNPLIGTLPSRDEILEEVKNLLSAM